MSPGGAGSESHNNKSSLLLFLERRFFFSEEKKQKTFIFMLQLDCAFPLRSRSFLKKRRRRPGGNQKTLTHWLYAAGLNRDSDKRSFASFLQKRRLSRMNRT
jgi:hypothetical protein